MPRRANREALAPTLCRGGTAGTETNLTALSRTARRPGVDGMLAFRLPAGRRGGPDSGPLRIMGHYPQRPGDPLGAESGPEQLPAAPMQIMQTMLSV